MINDSKDQISALVERLNVRDQVYVYRCVRLLSYSPDAFKRDIDTLVERITTGKIKGEAIERELSALEAKAWTIHRANMN